jgi:hypothetical protein
VLFFLSLSSVRCYAYLAARTKRSRKIVSRAPGIVLALAPLEHAIAGKEQSTDQHDAPGARTPD